MKVSLSGSFNMPWASLLEIAIKLLGFILGRVDAENKSRAAFLAFIQDMEKNGLISAKIKIENEDRLKSLAEKRKNAQNSTTNS